MSEFEITVKFDELVAVYNCIEGKHGHTFVNADQRYLVSELEMYGEKTPAIGWVNISHPTAALSKGSADVILYFALAKRIDYDGDTPIVDESNMLIMRTNMREPWPEYTAYAGNQIVYQDGIAWSGTASELEAFLEKYAEDMVLGRLSTRKKPLNTPSLDTMQVWN